MPDKRMNPTSPNESSRFAGTELNGSVNLNKSDYETNTRGATTQASSSSPQLSKKVEVMHSSTITSESRSSETTSADTTNGKPTSDNPSSGLANSLSISSNSSTADLSNVDPVDYSAHPNNNTHPENLAPATMESHPATVSVSNAPMGKEFPNYNGAPNLNVNGDSINPSEPQRLHRADLRLMDDTTSADAIIDLNNHEPAKPAFLMSLKTFGWWLLLPMIVIGGLAGSLFGMIIYWVTAQDFGINYTMTTSQTPEGAQTLLPVDGQSVSMNVASGLLSNATVWSLIFTGVSAIAFFLMKWRKRSPDASGSLSWRTNGKLDVWWKMLTGALVGLAFYGAYLLVGWGLAAVGVNLTSSDTGSTVENMILDLWHTGGALSWFNLVMLLLCVCIINPIAEEFVFRGMIGRRLVDSKMLRTGVGSNGPRKWWGSLLVCLLGGLFFGVVHFTSLSMAGILPVILTTLFGALCVWLSSIKTRSLWVSIAAHVAFNSVQMLILVLTLL